MLNEMTSTINKFIGFIFFWTPDREPHFGTFVFVSIRQIVDAYVVVLLIAVLAYLSGAYNYSHVGALIGGSVFIFFEELSRWSFCYRAKNKIIGGIRFAVYISIWESIFYIIPRLHFEGVDLSKKTMGSIEYMVLSFLLMRLAALIFHVIYSLGCAVSYKYRRSTLVMIFMVVFLAHFWIDLNIGILSG